MNAKTEGVFDGTQYVRDWADYWRKRALNAEGQMVRCAQCGNAGSFFFARLAEIPTQSECGATPASPTPAAGNERDADWVLAIGHALGLDSGHHVPIVPSVEEFKRLFTEVRATQAGAQERSE